MHLPTGQRKPRQLPETYPLAFSTEKMVKRLMSSMRFIDGDRLSKWMEKFISPSIS